MHPAAALSSSASRSSQRLETTAATALQASAGYSRTASGHLGTDSDAIDASLHQALPRQLRCILSGVVLL